MKRGDLVQDKKLKNWHKVPVMIVDGWIPDSKGKEKIIDGIKFYKCSWWNNGEYLESTFGEDELELV